MRLYRFLKEWALIIAIVSGIAGYFVYAAIPALIPTRHFVMEAIGVIQPVLIFAMLFLTFCRIDPARMRMRGWHGWLLLVQCGLFIIIGLMLVAMPHSGLRVVLEGVMICLICPTATAGAVVTRRLGGDVNGITTYIIAINIATAVLIPAVVPFVHPNPSMTAMTSALLILGKVFPLLLFPLVAALLLKRLWPRLHGALAEQSDLSFYLWAVALALATAVTARSIVKSDIDLHTQLWLVAVSLACCLLQFGIGKRIGVCYGARITAGQSLGQKNTVLAIWMGYTFFTPVTAIVGGFYSIWHNVINTWQLHEYQKRESAVENHDVGHLSA